MSKLATELIPRQAFGRWLMLLVVLRSFCGCGRVGYDLLIGSLPVDDGGTNQDGSATTGGPYDPRDWQLKPKLCNVWSLFGAATAVTPLNTVDGDEFPGSFSFDGLTIYFSSSSASRNAKSNDFYTATRSAGNGVWVNVTQVAELATTAAEHDFWVAQNGLEAFFTRSGPPNQIYHATRATKFVAWTTPSGPVPEFQSSSGTSTPVLSYDGKELYVNSSRAGTLGAADLWRFTRSAPNATWGTAEHLPAPLSTVNDDQLGSISADGLELYGAVLSGGNYNLWVSTRATVNDAWGTPTVISGSSGDIATSAQELQPVISADGTTLFFSTDRGTAKYEIYQATRTCIL